MAKLYMIEGNPMVETILITSSFLIIHSYLLYPIILWLIPARNKYQQSSGTASVDVTIVISAYNEEKTIRQRIENLLQLLYSQGKMEIIIGSDGSTDATNAIVREFSNRGVHLVEFSGRRGKAAVLNDLLLMAKNEIVIFSDANTFFHPDVVDRFVTHFHDEQIGGVCGYLQLHSRDDNSGGKGESFYWEYENIIKELEGKIYTVFGATGAVYAIRKKLYTPLPTDRLITDDFLIPIRIVQKGYRVLYDRTIIAREDATESSKKEFRRKVRIGTANFNCLREIMPLLHPKHGFVAFGILSHKILRWFVPFLLVLLFLSSWRLSGESAVYTVMFDIQLTFLAFAAIGYVLDVLAYPIKLFTLPYYFLVANFGLLLGFMKFMMKSDAPSWSATR